MNRLLQNLFLLGLILAGNCARGQDFVIRGSVIDEETYEPIPDAKLEIVNISPVRVVKADEDGNFEFTNLPQGKYRLAVSANQYDANNVGFEAKSNSFLKLKLIKQVIEGTAKTVEDRYNTKVSTASRTFEKVADAPGTVYIITSQDIEERGYTSLAEVLEDLPEIEMQDRVNSNTYNQFTMRGISGNERFLVMIDGIRRTSAATSITEIDKNFPIRYAKRIEVLIGTASAVYGANAATGVINIITEMGKNVRGVQASTSYGMYNTSESHFMAGMGNNKFSFALVGALYNSDEPDLNKYYKNDFAWYNDQYATNGNVLGNFAGTDTLQLASRGFYNTRQGYMVMARMDFLKNFHLTFSRRQQSHSANINALPQYTDYGYASRYGHSLTNFSLTHDAQSKKPNRWLLTSIFHYNSYLLRDYSIIRNILTDYQSTYSFGSNLNFRWLENFAYNIDANHRITGGISVQYSYCSPNLVLLPKQPKLFQSLQDQQLYYYGTDYTDPDGVSTRIAHEFYQFNQIEAGGFIQYQGKLSDKLSMNASFRFDYIHRKLINSDAVAVTAPTTNPRIGFIYKPSERMRIKLFYGEAFIAPSPEKLYQHYGLFTPQFDSLNRCTGFYSYYFHLTNPNLAPEKMRSMELSANYSRKNLGIIADVYGVHATNIITTARVDSHFFKGVPIAYADQSVNSGTEWAYGGSVRIEYRIPLGLGEKNIKLYAGYSYSGGMVDDSLKLPFTAPHTIKAGIHIHIKRFSLDTRAIFRTGSYNDHYLHQDKNEAFVLVNAFAKYRVVGGNQKKFTLDIFAKVRNALDQRYYNPAVYSLLNYELSPQDPIRASLGISMGFVPPAKPEIAGAAR